MKLVGILFVAAGLYLLFWSGKVVYKIFSGGMLPLKPKPGQTVEEYEKEVRGTEMSKLSARPQKMMGKYMLSMFAVMAAFVLLIIGWIILA